MKSTTSATLLLVATFLLGGITGGIAHYLYQNQLASASTGPPARRSNPGEIAQQMAKELQLDEQQTEQLRAIFKNGRDRYRALSLQFRPQYDAVRKETNEEIRKILNPEQAARYDAFLKEVDSRRRERPPLQR